MFQICSSIVSHLTREDMKILCLSCPELLEIFLPFLVQDSVLEIEDPHKFSTLLETQGGRLLSLRHLEFLQFPIVETTQIIFTSLCQQLKSLKINCSAESLTIESTTDLFVELNKIGSLETLRLYVNKGIVTSELADAFKNDYVSTIGINFEKFQSEVINSIVHNFSKLKHVEISREADIKALRSCLYSKTFFDGHVVRYCRYLESKGVNIYEIVDTKSEKKDRLCSF